MKKYQKAKILLENKARNVNKKPIYATRKLSIGLVSCMLGLVMAMPVAHAEDFDISQVDSNLSAIEDEASEEVLDSDETSDKPLPLVDDEANKTELDGLEIQDADKLELGPEAVLEPVQQSTVSAPTISKVFYDSTTISGGNVHRGRIGGNQARGTIHVTLKDSSGNEKASVSVTPKSGTTWTVSLPAGVTVAEGDRVTAYQEFDGQQSTETTAIAEPSLAYNHKNDLKMPSGDFYLEQFVANIVNADEKAEALQRLKDANQSFANDIDSVKFEIRGIEKNKVAYYTVTYTDGSKSEEILATDLKIIPVTEYSRNAKLNEITIVDNEIKGKLEGDGPFDGMKVQLVLNVNKGKSGDFCTDKGCKIDKDSSDPIEATVQSDGTFPILYQKEQV